MDFVGFILQIVLGFQTEEPGTVFEPVPPVVQVDPPADVEGEDVETGSNCWSNNSCESNDDGETIGSDTEAVVPGAVAEVPDEFPEGFLPE